MEPNTSQPSIGPSLEELEQKHFLVPDSIMDPQIVKNMKSYIKSGGQINTVIDRLSNSYRGYTQMTSLIYSWMQSPLIGLSTEQIDKMIIEYLKSVIIKHFDSKKADEIFASVCHFALVDFSIIDDFFLESTQMVGIYDYSCRMEKSHLSTFGKLSSMRTAQLCHSTNLRKWQLFERNCFSRHLC